MTKKMYNLHGNWRGRRTNERTEGWLFQLISRSNDFSFLSCTCPIDRPHFDEQKVSYKSTHLWHRNNANNNDDLKVIIYSFLSFCDKFVNLLVWHLCRGSSSPGWWSLRAGSRWSRPWGSRRRCSNPTCFPTFWAIWKCSRLVASKQAISCQFFSVSRKCFYNYFLILRYCVTLSS